MAVCVCVCVCFQSCLTFCNPKDYSPTRLLCPWNFPDKNTGVGCHFLLQGFFLTQGWNPHLLNPLHWQVDSLPLNHQGNPLIWIFLSQRIWDVYVATYFASTFRRAENKSPFQKETVSIRILSPRITDDDWKQSIPFFSWGILILILWIFIITTGKKWEWTV